MSKLPFYHKFYEAMLQPLHALMVHGVRVDTEKMRERHAALRAECKTLGAELDRLCGAAICTCGHGGEAHLKKKVNIWKGVLRKDGKERVARWKVVRRCLASQEDDFPGRDHRCPCDEFTPKRPTLVGTKDISNAKLAAYLYDHLGLPEQKAPRGEGERTRTANELACIRLRRVVTDFLAQPKYARERVRTRWKKMPKRVLKVLDAVLRFKRAAKLSTFCNVKKVDPDGRMRCSYKFTTITGRLSSSKNPMGGGYNLQNVDREIRDCFLPDQDGWVFVEADYSRGENRILYTMTGDPELLRIAQAQPEEVDPYRETAARMFEVPLAEVTKEQRRAGKQTELASGYGMGAFRHAEQLALEGEDRTVEECQEYMDAYFRARPQVLTYQKWVRSTIMAKRKLVTGWGRELNVEWARLSKDVYKQGYAFLPQSTLGDALNQRGLIPMHKWLGDGTTWQSKFSKINLQVHDALVLSCPRGEVYEVMTELHRTMTEPIPVPTITGKLIQLSIPVELKVGLNWAFKPGVEFKSLPSEKEVWKCLKTLIPS